IAAFAKGLVDQGWQVLASGGTAKILAAAGISVRDVAELVGGEAILGHKVVTLSREIHAGLLAGYETDKDEMERLGLSYIDLVCVDLYPLEQEQDNLDRTLESIRQKTDVGGPTMLHAAAKGGRLIVCDPDDRQGVLDWLSQGSPNEAKKRLAMAIKAEMVAAHHIELSEQLLTEELTKQK
ncbi:MAG TPA: hypothetical protein VF272_01825, partial [Candidatus Saccharimonadia bacterium]